MRRQEKARAAREKKKEREQALKEGAVDEYEAAIQRQHDAANPFVRAERQAQRRAARELEEGDLPE